MAKTFSGKDLSTITLALSLWAERCKTEAKTMDDWSKDPKFDDETRAKCVANAAASRTFETDARALLAKI